MKKIYLVGGSVRDTLLDIESYDKDFVAVGYKEDEFSHLKRVGKDFPIFLQEDGSELALARKERKTSSGYNGFEVQTKDVTLQEDLSRRDLTINAIAYDQQDDIYIDPYGGQEDIKKKVLRHTTEAFCEDPLRVLRLARFRAKLGYEWKIAPGTKVLVYSMKDELKSLEPQRVYKEVQKVFDTKNARVFFETLFELGVLEDIFPNIFELILLKEGSIYHKESSVFEHTMCVLENLHHQSHLLQLTALYHDIAKPYCYRTFGNSSGHEMIKYVESRIELQLPSKFKKELLFLIENHIKIAILDQMKPSKIASFFESFKKNRELFENLLRFYKADNYGRITDKNLIDLDEDKLLELFDAISSYKVSNWIQSHEEHPSGEAIKQHIHKKNIEIVKRIFVD